MGIIIFLPDQLLKGGDTRGKTLAQPTEAFRFRGEPDHPHWVYQSREASLDRYCLRLWHYWRSRLLIASRFRINRPSNSQNGIRTEEGSGEKKTRRDQPQAYEYPIAWLFVHRHGNFESKVLFSNLRHM